MVGSLRLFKNIKRFGLTLGAVFGIPTNVCLIVGDDAAGVLYGYDSSYPFGSADPQYFEDDTFFYALTWDNTGQFELRAGVDGNIQIPDTPALFVYYPPADMLVNVQWDETVGRYIGNNGQMSERMISDYKNGVVEQCLFVGIQDGIVIHYTYDSIDTEEV